MKPNTLRKPCNPQIVSSHYYSKSPSRDFAGRSLTVTIGGSPSISRGLLSKERIEFDDGTCVICGRAVSLTMSALFSFPFDINFGKGARCAAWVMLAASLNRTLAGRSGEVLSVTWYGSGLVASMEGGALLDSFEPIVRDLLPSCGCG
jgi:hypothetical protein